MLKNLQIGSLLILCIVQSSILLAAEDQSSTVSPESRHEQTIRVNLSGRGISIDGKTHSSSLSIDYAFSFTEGAMHAPEWALTILDDPLIAFGRLDLDVLGSDWNRPWSQPRARRTLPEKVLDIHTWGLLTGTSPMLGISRQWSQPGSKSITLTGITTVPSVSLSRDQQSLLDIRYQREGSLLEVYGIIWDEERLARPPEGWYVDVTRGSSQQGLSAGAVVQRQEYWGQVLLHVQRVSDIALDTGSVLGIHLDLWLGDLELSLSSRYVSPSLPLYHYEDPAGNFDDTDLLSARWVVADYTHDTTIPIEFHLSLEERLYRYPIDIGCSRPAERTIHRNVRIGSQQQVQITLDEETLYRYETAPIGAIHIIDTIRGMVAFPLRWVAAAVVKVSGTVTTQDRDTLRCSGVLEVSKTCGSVCLSGRIEHASDVEGLAVQWSVSGEMGPVDIQLSISHDLRVQCELAARIVTF